MAGEFGWPPWRDDLNVVQSAASDAEKIVTFIKDLEQKRNQSIELAGTHTASMKAFRQPKYYMYQWDR
jgi:hypothetical protein